MKSYAFKSVYIHEIISYHARELYFKSIMTCYYIYYILPKRGLDVFQRNQPLSYKITAQINKNNTNKKDCGSINNQN